MLYNKKICKYSYNNKLKLLRIDNNNNNNYFNNQKK